jgi:membrane protein required for colicin V production
VTKFDYIVLALLVISALIGFVRGAVRELVALLALIAGAAAALLGLPYALPLAVRLAHPHWLATGLAGGLLFVGAYIGMRLVGAVLVKRIKGTNVLGALDRTIGLLIGVARGFVVLGALYLMFIAATPEDLRPEWITKARTWPLAQDMGALLTGLAPQGKAAAVRLGPSLQRVSSDPSRDRSTTGEYEARRGGEADDLVEMTR